MALEPLAPRNAAAAVRAWLSHGPEATEALGRELGSALRPGDVVALHGELGSGKTCLVRGIARGLGVEQDVTSPTFTLMHTYAGRAPVYHLDAWMQTRGEAFLADGGAEWLTGAGVALVEWAERVADWLPAARWSVELAHAGAEDRSLRVAWLGLPGARADAEASLRALATPPGCEERT
jgi:tRNA threonylcarbamoyladenosine biosynthesis protein TsaE